MTSTSTPERRRFESMLYPNRINVVPLRINVVPLGRILYPFESIWYPNETLPYPFVREDRGGGRPLPLEGGGLRRHGRGGRGDARGLEGAGHWGEGGRAARATDARRSNQPKIDGNYRSSIPPWCPPASKQGKRGTS